MKFDLLSTCKIDEFSLKWRWTDEKYCLMPENDLSEIRPLTQHAASITFENALRLTEKTQIEEDGESIETARGDSAVNSFLSSKLPAEIILVNWDQDTSVITDTATFTKYWDEFCYPSSDDVSVWPEDESWFLQCYHYDRFSFIKI